MARNGSGVYSPPGASFPAVASTLIEAAKFNDVINDMATAMTASIAVDGQSTIAANLSMSGFKLTSVGAGTARTDAASLATVQDGIGNYVGTVGGTADAITLTSSPAITAYAAGQEFKFIASGANTTNVTVAVSGLAAKDLTKNGTTALAASDIPASALVTITYDGTRFQLIGLVVSSSVVLGANTFTATQTIQSTDAGAGVGPIMVLDRDSASPAANDLIGKVTFQGNDSGAANQEYANVYGKIIDPTAASEDAQVITQTVIAGTLADRVIVGAGMVIGSATGGDLGAGTINATAVYDDGVLLAPAAAASQAEMEAASSTTVMVTPGRAKNAPSAAKAWVSFNGSGVVAINGSNNVTSITDVGTGSYTVNFTTAFSAATYAVAAWARDSNGTGPGVIVSQQTDTYSTTACSLGVSYGDAGNVDSSLVTAVFFGDQ